VFPRILLLLGLIGLPARAHDGDPPPELDSWLDAVVMLIIGPAWCSGVLIDDQGTVATAYHCVASGMRPRVHTREGEQYIGQSIAWSPSDDLALVSVPELVGRPYLELRSEPAPQGIRVYGLGHPFAPAADRKSSMQGLLQWSVTEGIVSAASERLVQTDAALNPGNSGGPVVDTSGRIVGITSHKINGDNVAFLASHQALSELVQTPEKRALGGQWGLGLGSLGGLVDHPVANVEILVQAVIREHLVGTIGLGFPIGARDHALERGTSWAVANEITLALRQRIGHGNWSTAIELGGGLADVRDWRAVYYEDTHTSLVLSEDRVLPLGFARLGMGGAWMRVGALWEEGEPTWLIGFDLDWPGPLGTF
jgi:hypothetical protein